MTNFQLTPEHRWYVNASGDKCKVALLNGVWVAVWDNGVVTKHFEDGREIRITRDYKPEFTITAPFEGWLSDPFDDAPPTVKHITVDEYGAYEWWFAEKPTADAGCWSLPHDPTNLAAGDYDHELYTGDWRNSLTSREDWQ